jgi:hypothetical protein
MLEMLALQMHLIAIVSIVVKILQLYELQGHLMENRKL